MEDQPNNKTEKRQRTKRVKDLKKGILIILLGWSLISMILCIYFAVKLHALERKFDLVLSSRAQRIQNEQTDVTAWNQNLPEVSEQNVYDDTDQEKETSGETTDEENIRSSQNLQDTDNLAKKGDMMKVYLTFDDGPSKRTSAILDILKKYNVKATFFVVAHDDEQSRSLYQRIVNEGHTLAMHSYTHDYDQVYGSLESFENDVTKLQDLLFDITGIRCRYYRFPGGSSNQRCKPMLSQIVPFLKKKGITYFDWNVCNDDAVGQSYSSAELTQKVLGTVTKYKTSIVLMHDTADKDTTVESLGTIIPSLQSMGAEILPIDENTTVVQHVSADSVD